MHSTPSLRSFPNVVFKMVPMLVWLTMALSRPFKEDCLALPLSSLFRAINGVMCLALCPQEESQAPQHLRSSEKQATWEGCYARQSVCSAWSHSEGDDSLLVHGPAHGARVANLPQGQLFQSLQTRLVEDVGAGQQHRLPHLTAFLRHCPCPLIAALFRLVTLRLCSCPLLTPTWGSLAPLFHRLRFVKFEGSDCFRGLSRVLDLAVASTLLGVRVRRRLLRGRGSQAGQADGAVLERPLHRLEDEKVRQKSEKLSARPLTSLFSFVLTFW